MKKVYSLFFVLLHAVSLTQADVGEKDYEHFSSGEKQLCGILNAEHENDSIDNSRRINTYETTIKPLFPDMSYGSRYRYDEFQEPDASPDAYLRAPVFFNRILQDIDDYFSFYAVGKFTNYKNLKLDLFVVRAYKYDQDKSEDSIRCDFLFVVKDAHILGTPFQISYNDPDNVHAAFNQSFYFDWDISLNVITSNSLEKNNEMSEQVEQHAIYDISPDGRLFILKEKTDTLADPQTYEQFRILFPRMRLNDPYPSSHCRIAWNNYINPCFDFPHQKIYVISRLNYRGHELFILRAEDEDNYWNAEGFSRTIDYCLIEDKADFNLQTEMPPPFLAKTYDIEDSEGGQYSEVFYFDKDTALIEYVTIEPCCSATGYNTGVKTISQYRYELFDGSGGLQEMEISSNFFFPDKITALRPGEYPDINNRYDIGNPDAPVKTSFYLTPSYKGGYCTQFVSYYVEGTYPAQTEIVIDEKCICSRGDRPLEKVKKQAKPQIPGLQAGKKEHPEKIIIRTGDGNIQLLPDGSFYVIREQKG